AIYWHFEGKADLFGALMREKTQRAAKLFREAFEETASPVAALEKLLVRSVELLDEDEEYRAVLEMGWFKTEATGELEQAFAQKVAGSAATVDAIAALVEKGKRAGEIREEVRVRAAALAAYALMGGLVTMHLMAPKLVKPKADARPAVRLLLAGILADRSGGA